MASRQSGARGAFQNRCNADGSVTVPAALCPYLGGAEKITRA